MGYKLKMFKAGFEDLSIEEVADKNNQADAYFHENLGAPESL